MKITRTITEEVFPTIGKYDRSNLNPKMYERTDILIIQCIGACNVFIETNGEYQIDLWDESIQVDKEEIARIVAETIADNKEFVAKQNEYVERYYAEKQLLKKQLLKKQL